MPYIYRLFVKYLTLSVWSPKGFWNMVLYIERLIPVFKSDMQGLMHPVISLTAMLIIPTRTPFEKSTNKIVIKLIYHSIFGWKYTKF